MNIFKLWSALAVAIVLGCCATLSLTAQEASPVTDSPVPSAAPVPDTLPASLVPLVSYQPQFLGADVDLGSHQASGYIIGGLFSGAAVAGWLHYGDLLNHNYSNDYLKYVHIGLVGTGEAFYLYNALTGISMIPKNGVDTKTGTLHMGAFFVHAALMVGQLVLGLMESDSLENLDTTSLNNIGLAHAIVGTAIPVVELASGILTNFPELLGE